MADFFDFNVTDDEIFEIDIGELVAEVEAEIAADLQEVWICALLNTCQDCLPRHGEVRSAEQWDADGRPATGWSVCGEFCQCQLIDSEFAADVPPLVRELDQTTRGLTVRVPAGLQGGDPETMENLRASLEVRRAFRLIGRQNNPSEQSFTLQAEREEDRERAQRQSAQRRRRRVGSGLI